MYVLNMSRITSNLHTIINVIIFCTSYLQTIVYALFCAYICDVSVHSCMCLPLIIHWLLQPIIHELEVCGISRKFLTLIQPYLRDRYRKVVTDKINAYDSVSYRWKKKRMPLGRNV